MPKHLPPRTAGRPAGTKNPEGHRAGRPSPPQDLHTTAFVGRCKVFHRDHYPGDKALYTAMGISARTFAYRLQGRRNFTPAQLAAAHAVLNAAAPWVQQPPPDTWATGEDEPG